MVTFRPLSRVLSKMDSAKAVSLGIEVNPFCGFHLNRSAQDYILHEASTRLVSVAVDRARFWEELDRVQQPGSG